MESLQTRQSSLNHNPRRPHTCFMIQSHYGYTLMIPNSPSLDLPRRSNNYSFLLTLVLVISVSELTVGLLFPWYP